MSAKQQTANISPVLFMTEDGEPLSFFLCPGPAKSKLKPLITAGGGMMSRVQQPGVILLIEPGTKSSCTASTAHWFVSTQYIYDCIEKNEQLNLEDYRLKPETVQTRSIRLTNAQQRANGLTGGRLRFTTEDDAAILSYVSKHSSETGGNRLWQEMEKKRVTGHSWQSMRTHYREQLAKKRTEVVEVLPSEEEAGAAGPENKKEDQEMKGERRPSVEDSSSPQVQSKDDLRQIDGDPTPAGPQGEVDPQADKVPAERTQVSTVEAETDGSPQPEVSCPNPLTDLHPNPVLDEGRELETDQQQTVVSLQKEGGSEGSVQPISTPNTPSCKKPKEKRKASPMPEQPQRRQTRRQLQLGTSSPEPYGKRLRSSTRSPKQLPQSPKSSSKTKSANKTVFQKDDAVDQPPPQTARGERVEAEAEGPQEERESPPVSEKTPTESALVLQNEEMKRQRRNLGILKMATDEFECESESEEDESQELQNSNETATTRPAEKEVRLPSPDRPPSTASGSEPEPSLQQNMQVSQASSTSCFPASGQEPPIETVEAVTNPHMFIFQNESQEEDSQLIFAADPAPAAQPQPAANKDSDFSLTQVQLEEGKQCIRDLMKETNKDLGTVTKALLKTSGDLSEALALLLNPASVSGPFWRCCDDALLLSSDPDVSEQLRDKYSEELLAKRIIFLELEG